MNPHPHRREILTGGLVALGLFLSGCNSSAKRDPRLGDPLPPKRDYYGRSRTPSSSGDAATVVRRAEWTRAQPILSNTDPMNGVQRITIHHDGMPPVSIRSRSDAANRLEVIRKSHLQRGWADIGYHYVVDPQGRVWEGRPINLQGAHVKDNNPHNLGIMVLGNFDEQRPTSAATGALDDFVAAQMRRYRVPLARVYTHQELMPTACPGRSLQAHMLEARARTGALARA